MRKEKGVIYFGLCAVILVSSLPLLRMGCPAGINLGFYLRQMQVGGAENWFFFLPALLVRAGIPLELVYKLFLVGLNAATAYIAYSCFHRIFEDEMTGLVGSIAYSWLPYRTNNLYCRADIGEAVAMTFLPLVFYGLFRLFAEETETKAYKQQWILLTLGLTLLFQAYLLSFLTVAGFVLALCILKWKKALRKPTLLVLLKTALAFGILNAWSAGLLYYRFRAGQFPFGIVGNGAIQSRGVYLSNFFQLFFRDGNSADVAESGMRQLQPYGLGFAVTVAVLVWLWQCFVGRYGERQEKQELKSFVRLMNGGGVLLAVMTTNAFPWDMLPGLGSLFRILIACLYEPTRLMPLAAVCLTMTACMAVWQVSRWESAETKKIFLLALAVIAVVSTWYLMGDIRESRTYLPGEAYETETEYQLSELDISPLDYARYEGNRYPMPKVLLLAETASAACMCVLIGVAWRKRHVEK